MNKDDVSIWMPIYIGDILAMTTRLTTEQVGALYLLMMDYWKNGAIPNDNKIIGAITGLPSAKAKSFVKNIINIGIFSIEKDELFSAYLDDKKSQATDNKNSKSERAQKAAQARWGKASAENQPSNDALNGHNPSNANAMLKQSTSNAKGMLEQCPSSSPSSINNIHTYTGEKIPDSQEAKAEQIRLERSQEIQDWQAPSLDSMREELFHAGFSGVLNDDMYQMHIKDFKAHFAEQALLGKPLNTDSLRKSKLRLWIQNAKPTKQARKPQSQLGGANDPLAVNQKWRPNETGIVAPNTNFEFINGELVATPLDTSASAQGAW